MRQPSQSSRASLAATPDRYGSDVLATPSSRAFAPEVPADTGLVVEDAETGWCGAVLRVERSGGMHLVELEDGRGRVRSFQLGAGFLVEGVAVRLVPPRRPSPPGPSRRTASGSTAVRAAPARVARGSRLWVEGRHDAELVEKIWGDDLRVEAVVVEPLDGVDGLAAALGGFDPGPGRRVGVLVDHLVPGTKESRTVREALAATPGRCDVLVVGHPYVDIWQAVRPTRLGLTAWPQVPREVEWKRGILGALGWPQATQTDVAQGWKRILGSVRDYSDLEPALLARVEELIDFVTAG